VGVIWDERVQYTTLYILLINYPCTDMSCTELFLLSFLPCFLIFAILLSLHLVMSISFFFLLVLCMILVRFMCDDDYRTHYLYYKLSVLHNLSSSGGVKAECPSEITRKEEHLVI